MGLRLPMFDLNSKATRFIGVLSLMVIVIGNGIRNPSSNPR